MECCCSLVLCIADYFFVVVVYCSRFVPVLLFYRGARVATCTAARVKRLVFITIVIFSYLFIGLALPMNYIGQLYIQFIVNRLKVNTK